MIAVCLTLAQSTHATPSQVCGHHVIEPRCTEGLQWFVLYQQWIQAGRWRHMRAQNGHRPHAHNLPVPWLVRRILDWRELFRMVGAMCAGRAGGRAGVCHSEDTLAEPTSRRLARLRTEGASLLQSLLASMAADCQVKPRGLFHRHPKRHRIFTLATVPASHWSHPAPPRL